MKTVDFSESIAASDLKVSRSSHLIEYKVLKVKVISLPYIFQVLYVLYFTRPRHQVSVYRTTGPLVFFLTAMPGSASYLGSKHAIQVF